MGGTPFKPPHQGKEVAPSVCSKPVRTIKFIQTQQEQVLTILHTPELCVQPLAHKAVDIKRTDSQVVRYSIWLYRWKVINFPATRSQRPHLSSGLPPKLQQDTGREIISNRLFEFHKRRAPGLWKHPQGTKPACHKCTQPASLRSTHCLHLRYAHNLNPAPERKQNPEPERGPRGASTYLWPSECSELVNNLSLHWSK